MQFSPWRSMVSSLAGAGMPPPLLALRGAPGRVFLLPDAPPARWADVDETPTPAVSDEVNGRVPFHVQLSHEQAEKLEQLGGLAWLEKVLDEVEEP